LSTQPTFLADVLKVCLFLQMFLSQMLIIPSRPHLRFLPSIICACTLLLLSSCTSRSTSAENPNTNSVSGNAPDPNIQQPHVTGGDAFSNNLCSQNAGIDFIVDKDTQKFIACQGNRAVSVDTGIALGVEGSVNPTPEDTFTILRKLTFDILDVPGGGIAQTNIVLAFQKKDSGHYNTLHGWVDGYNQTNGCVGISDSTATWLQAHSAVGDTIRILRSGNASGSIQYKPIPPSTQPPKDTPLAVSQNDKKDGLPECYGDWAQQTAMRAGGSCE
jgi:hypothetical protein